MEKDNNNVSLENEEALFEEYITSNHGEAEKLLNDEDKLEKFLQKLENKLKTVPVAGTSLAYVPVMISLVRAYLKKEYTEPPVVSLVSIIAVKTDIQDYMIWRKENGREFTDLPKYEDIEKEAKEQGKIINIFMRGRGSKK